MQKRERDTANQAWLRRHNLLDSTRRTIIQNYYRVSGQYPVGIPTIDWEENEVTVSVRIDAKTVIHLEFDLSSQVLWNAVPGTTQPTVKFIYSQEYLDGDFNHGDYYDTLEYAVKQASLRRVLNNAQQIEITLSPEQYVKVHKSLI